MTLPANFPLSMSQIGSEIGLSLPLSLAHGWIIALAGKQGAPVSFSDLLGKTGRFDGAVYTTFVGPPANEDRIVLNGAPFFGGAINYVGTVDGGGFPANLFFSSAPNWSGNIQVTNNTTGISMVLSPASGTQWNAPSADASFIRRGQTDSFTILPSF